MIFDAKVAVTPAGNPTGEPIPVAPTVGWVILVPSAVPIHKVGVAEAGPAILAEVIVIVPVAFTLPQPPVNGML